MKKALSLILALVMVLSLTVPAFAETDNSTDITLTVAKSLTYDMVIPEDVTDLANYGIYSVGQAKVANVKNATDKTVISYTAATTAFKSEGKTDIPASYYTDLQGTITFPTTAVEVYKNKADVASLPTMYVGISENAWNAAENGTYTATVTFNFEAKEVSALPATMTIAEILATAESAIPSTTTAAVVPDGAWKSGENSCYIEKNEKLIFRSASDGMTTDIKIFDHSTANEAQLTEGNYVYTNDTKTCTFVMQNGKLTAIAFSESGYSDYDGTYTAPTT